MCDGLLTVQNRRLIDTVCGSLACPWETLSQSYTSGLASILLFRRQIFKVISVFWSFCRCLFLCSISFVFIVCEFLISVIKIKFLWLHNRTESLCVEVSKSTENLILPKHQIRPCYIQYITRWYASYNYSILSLSEGLLGQHGDCSWPDQRVSSWDHHYRVRRRQSGSQLQQGIGWLYHICHRCSR